MIKTIIALILVVYCISACTNTHELDSTLNEPDTNTRELDSTLNEPDTFHFTQCKLSFDYITFLNNWKEKRTYSSWTDPTTGIYYPGHTDSTSGQRMTNYSVTDIDGNAKLIKNDTDTIFSGKFLPTYGFGSWTIKLKSINYTYSTSDSTYSIVLVGTDAAKHVDSLTGNLNNTYIIWEGNQHTEKVETNDQLLFSNCTDRTQIEIKLRY